MIYDNLENLNQYYGLFERLDTAIEFIENTDLAALPLGRTDVAEGVFVTVMDVQTTPGEGRPFETHSRYMDLQMDLAGTELCEAALGGLEAHTPYDAESDAALWNAAASAAVVLGEGRFALFMVEEAHKPAIQAAGSSQVRKAVFKIAY